MTSTSSAPHTINKVPYLSIPKPLRDAAQSLELFYTATPTTRNSRLDVAAAGSALELLMTIDKLQHIVSVEQRVFRENGKSFWQAAIDTQREQYPLIFVACFPGHNPAAFQSLGRQDTTHRAIIIAREQQCGISIQYDEKKIERLERFLARFNYDVPRE